MLKVAVVVNGEVANTVVAETLDSARAVLPGAVLVDITNRSANRGDQYDADTDTFTAPPQPELPPASPVV